MGISFQCMWYDLVYLCDVCACVRACVLYTDVQIVQRDNVYVLFCSVMFC